MDVMENLVTKTTLKNLPQSFPLEFLKEGDYIDLQIGNIYSPSTFWIIHKYKELDIFMKYLKEFYTKATNNVTISINAVSTNMMCIVNRNNLFYRGVIVNLLIGIFDKVKVFLLDYGLIVNVKVSELCFIHKQFCGVKRFAIRASLANISPINMNRFWSVSDTKAFVQLFHKDQMIAKISHVDHQRGILNLYLANQFDDDVESINYCMLRLGIAKYSGRESEQEKTNGKCYIPKVKYLYLYPTFEALEFGLVPSTLFEYQMLKDVVPLDHLYPSCYQFLYKSD